MEDSKLTRNAILDAFHGYGCPPSRFLIGGEYERQVVRKDGSPLEYGGPDGIRWLLEEYEDPGAADLHPSTPSDYIHAFKPNSPHSRTSTEPFCANEQRLEEVKTPEATEGESEKEEESNRHKICTRI